ncbi:FAD-dependent oxidoreductase [Cohnella ginsengisoli]|uniref:FAD-dependent oxidoreductase n=1 Tax=Cohnella ginsengisoli TaxID=425004 RepID=A0A9X4QPC4_9BACL|nr:FAD-dependent oxidoreductase [Cohnella ginsengisoli]MDG0793758.1 FAD-dependent oxidoreductase [Cohnella ginsengisoli]
MSEIKDSASLSYEATDVAIIGAGIAGSGLAKSLADRGRKVLLIDRKRFPRHKACGGISVAGVDRHVDRSRLRAGDPDARTG